MYKKVLENITGIEIYPEISLIIFFVFFLLILGWSFTLNKSFIKHMENIPLDEEPETKNEHNFNAGGVK